MTGRSWGVGRFLLPLFFSTVFPAPVVARLVVPTDLQADLRDLKLADESGEIRLYIRNVLIRHPAFAAPLMLGGRLDVVGIAEQYHSGPPLSSGYRLLVRDRSDFRFPLIIPFKTMALSTIITVLVAMMCPLVVRRRAAERREGEKTLLLERITRTEEKRQQTEEALSLSAEIADNMAEGVYLIRVQDGQIVYANRRFEQMFGRDTGEMLGKHFSLLSAPGARTPEEVAEEIIGSLKKTGSWRGEVQSVKKDAIPFWCRVTVSTFEHARYGTTGVFLCEDITERRRMEEEIRRHSEGLEKLVDLRTARVLQLEQQRRKNEQLAAMGQVAAAVAHEINNPLVGIKNAFLLIKGAIPADHPHAQFVGLIEREINRISTVVRQMYQLYRPESHKVVRFDMGVVVAEIFSMLEGTIKERDLILKLEIPPDLPHVRLPEAEVRQVLYNLIQNAVHASPNGTELVVGVAHSGGSIRVGVTDRGEGIPPHVLPHIMEPFFTTRQGNSDSGMGLGLSVSHTLIKAMGGSIEVETQAGQGTTMTMVLPCQQVIKKVALV